MLKQNMSNSENEKKQKLQAEETAEGLQDEAKAVEDTEVDMEVDMEMEQDSDIEEEKKEEQLDNDIIKKEMPVQEAHITPEEADEYQKIAAFEDAFWRRSITIPGKRKQRAAFRDEEVILGDANHEMDSLGSLRKKEYDLLSDSAKASKPKVLYGRVYGVEEMEIGTKKVPFCVCNLIAENYADIRTDKEITSSIYKIKIPAPLMMIYDESEYEGEEGYATLKKRLDMRVGSIVEFVVYDINMENTEVLASRVRAMQLLSYDAYLGKNKFLYPGCKVKGNVTYINRSGILVDVFGAEFFVPYNELSWRYIENALDQSEFTVGGPVVVRLKSMEPARKEIYGHFYPYMKVTGSVKDAYENPNRLYFNKYELHQKYRGQIAFRLPQGAYIVNLGSEREGINGNRATCICKAPSDDFGGVPFVGQNCSVVIVSKDEETHNMSGAFVYREQKRMF